MYQFSDMRQYLFELKATAPSGGAFHSLLQNSRLRFSGFFHCFHRSCRILRLIHWSTPSRQEMGIAFQPQRHLYAFYATLGTPVQQLFQNFNELIPFLSVHRCEEGSQGILLPAPCGHILRERKAQELLSFSTCTRNPGLPSSLSNGL